MARRYYHANYVASKPSTTHQLGSHHGVVVVVVSQGPPPDLPRRRGGGGAAGSSRAGGVAAGVLRGLAVRPDGVPELHVRRRGVALPRVLRGVRGRLRRQPLLPLLRRRRHVRARHGLRRQRLRRAPHPRRLRSGRPAHRALHK